MRLRATPSSSQAQAANESLFSALYISAFVVLEHLDDFFYRRRILVTPLCRLVGSMEPRYYDYICPKCDGDGYIETWNNDQSDVVITSCSCQLLAQGIENSWLDSA